MTKIYPWDVGFRSSTQPTEEEFRLPNSPTPQLPHTPLLYTPNPTHVGTDTFTYIGFDADGQVSNLATVNITTLLTSFKSSDRVGESKYRLPDRINRGYCRIYPQSQTICLLFDFL
jgi:hypothetical protein